MVFSKAGMKMENSFPLDTFFNASSRMLKTAQASFKSVMATTGIPAPTTSPSSEILSVISPEIGARIFVSFK